MPFPGQFSGLLIQTAVVYRRHTDENPTVAKTNRFGQPTRDEAEHHREPCRVTSASGGRVMAERSHDVVQINHTLFLERGADIKETDVVTVLGENDYAVVERATVDLVKYIYDGTSVHHIEAKLNSQRQATGVSSPA